VNVDVIEEGRYINIKLDVDGSGEMERNGVLPGFIPGEGTTDRPGYPELSAVGRWVRVPDRGRLELDYQIEGIRRVSGVPPVVYQDPTADATQPTARLDDIWPPEQMVMGQPVVMRGVRMVPLVFYPVRWDPTACEYVISEGFSADIKATAKPGINEVVPMNRRPSRGFDRMLEALLVNPPRRDQPEDYLPGGYLVVVNHFTADLVEEFTQWKRMAGHPVELLTFNPEEVGQVELKEMILEIYEETGFEFLVLVGNEDAGPELYCPYDDDFYDIYFGQLEGNDPFPEVAVGTFNCLEVDNLTCAVRRAVSYQSEPYIEDEDWFTRAGVGIGHCNPPDQRDFSPSYTGKWVEEVLRRRGFDDITTNYFSDNGVNDFSPMIYDLYNEGVNFILVRGHQSDFDTDFVATGEIYPFHFLVSSATIQQGNFGAFNQAFRMGTPDDMRGASAGFGHWGSPRTNIANALAGGLTQAMFLLDLGSYGWARNYTVANLLRVMPDDDLDYLTGYFHTWRYYGDPGQWCWIGVPKELDVEYPQMLDPDATDLVVIVTTADDDRPVTGATVSLSRDDDVQMVTATGPTGWAYFTFERGQLEGNELQVAVTGKNLYPHLGEIQIEEEEIFLALIESEVVDEEGGDGDGIPNPGETVELYLGLQNTGDRPTNRMALSLLRFSLWAEVRDQAIMLGELEPGQAVFLEEPFTVRILEGCPDGELLPFRLVLGGMGTAGLDLEVEAPALAVLEVVIEGDLDPGEDVELDPFITNIGHKDADPLDAILEPVSPFVSIPAAISQFPEIPIQEVVQLAGDPFVVRADSVTVPGSEAEFRLILEGEPGVLDTLHFSLMVGEAAEGDPLGPDSYGYIALNDGDDDTEWAAAPVFDWLDINRWHGDVEGEVLSIRVEEEEGDSTALVELPFPLRYYGEEFGEISVCSNGWLAVGDQINLENQQNWPLPGPGGAFGMMAVFWDRCLYALEDDGVFTYYDEGLGRFLIQWDTFVEDDGDPGANVFQAILFDPERYETPTGDSPILFQYRTVNNIQDRWEANPGASVGISSPDGLDGLTYTYWNDYPPACAPLVEGRAILWTTISYTPGGTITGRVTRYIDSTAVAGALVRTSHGFETITRQDGTYTLWNVEPDTFDITASKERYGDATVEDVELEEAGEIEVDFVMPHGWPILTEPDTLRVNVRNYGSLIRTRLGGAIVNQGNYDCAIVAFEFVADTLTWPQTWLVNITLDGDSVIRLLDTLVITYEFDIDPDVPDGNYEASVVFLTDSPVENLTVHILGDVTRSIDGVEQPLPADYALSDLFPNPFNASTTIAFALPINSQVIFNLYDSSGRMVRTVIEGRYRAGWHQSNIDAAGLATGLYFLRMDAGEFRATRRLLLVR